MSRPFAALVVNPFITDFKLYDEWMHPLGLYFLIDLLPPTESMSITSTASSGRPPCRHFSYPHHAALSPAENAPVQETASPPGP